ncbi:MAG: HD domain-containing protein [Kangiellaceae bacterium]|nr:HD domain-containing protein [Kangiellaceae bacterium]MCW9015898.1 HD domain-containing protein [Kangiellaceae bacterium]
MSQDKFLVHKKIEDVLNFIVEVEKLKDVHRKTRPVGLERYENSAEHSWHVCLSALMLKDFADDPVDIDRVIKMLLIHDLGEIDVGDTIIYQSETKQAKEKEARGVRRVLSLLPDNSVDEYMALWYEFEEGESDDAKFAKAIDRVPPLLHNLHGDFHSWRTHNIPKQKVLELNGRIAKGSVALWQVISEKIKQAFSDGKV